MKRVKITATGSQSKRRLSTDQFPVPESGKEADDVFGAERASDLILRALRIYIQDNYLRPELDNDNSELDELVKNVTAADFVWNYVKNAKTNRPSQRIVEIASEELDKAQKDGTLAELLASHGVVVHYPKSSK